MNKTRIFTAGGVFAFLCLSGAVAQTVSALRATEIRADKLGNAAVLSTLPTGAALAIIAIEGGWAQVLHESPTGKVTGWVRAGNLNLSSGASTASGIANGRQASGNAVLTLGVRSLPVRVNRHALIIGISRYADASTPPLAKLTS